MLAVVGVKLFKKMNFSANFRIALAGWFYRPRLRLQQARKVAQMPVWNILLLLVWLGRGLRLRRLARTRGLGCHGHTKPLKR